MQAVRYVGGDEPIAVTAVERPTVGPGEVRIDVRAASICGSDVHYREEATEFSPGTVPVTLGHEGAGVVTEVSNDVTAVSVGDRAIIHYVHSCGHCHPCLAGKDNRCRHRSSIGHDVDGTFAEEIVVPASCAIPMADTVPFAWGSVVGCAGATAFHATKRAGIEPGESVAVFGAGGVGLQAIMWSVFRGAGTVIVVEPIAARREAADEFGADLTLDPERDDVAEAIAAMTDGWGADVALECSGAAEAMTTAFDAVDGDNRYESGTVVSIGLQETPLTATYWGLREGALYVSGDHTRSELRTIADLMASNRVDVSAAVADRIALDAIEEGFDRVAAGADTGRIVVEP